MADEAFGEEEIKEVPAEPKGKKAKAAAKDVSAPAPVSAEEQVAENKRTSKIRRAIEYAVGAKCDTCIEGAASDAVKNIINAAVARLESALELLER